MVETLARLGYICKAFIYTIIGSLAIAAALRRGGRITDAHRVCSDDHTRPRLAQCRKGAVANLRIA